MGSRVYHIADRNAPAKSGGARFPAFESIHARGRCSALSAFDIVVFETFILFDT